MAIAFEDSVEKVPLIGPLKARLLKNLEIETVGDLLNHYPFRYDDLTTIKKISHLLYGETVTVFASVIKTEHIYTKSRKSMVRAVISDETGQIDAVWFNQPYLAGILKPGISLSLSGKIDWFAKRLVLVSPDYELISNNSPSDTIIHTGRLVPIYPETAGISSKWLRSRINFLLRGGADIKDFFPDEFLNTQGLVGLSTALNQIHFPKSLEDSYIAKKRLAFDELFTMILKSQFNRKKSESQEPKFRFDAPKNQNQLSKFCQSLPFKLTDDQIGAVDEILKDLGRAKPMNRLLQGDVGSGKTVVAAIAALACHLQGFETLYMAPTEILANQHYQTFKKFLEPFGIRVGLMTSSNNKNSKSSRREVGIPTKTSGQIMIGTHALLYNLEKSKEVGLVIIDEQHKFGVQQRTRLLELSKNSPKLPHLLTMTATPIPRTLALTVLGDLDITFINQMPGDRIPIKTWVVPKEKRSPAYEWIKKQLIDNDSQAYIVCPFIEESEAETLKSVKAAKKEFDKLIKIFSPLKVELLHGKMKSQQKEEVMKNFNLSKTRLLVSTPVVEVGIDNPNATIILVEGAERFGLASLHQLRGRVGRGNKQSYCLLFTENENPEAIQRLKLLEVYNSGLKLSEMDLKRRGGGEVYGKQQSGFAKTKAADLTDTAFIVKVDSLVKDLFKNNDPILESPTIRALINQEESFHRD